MTGRSYSVIRTNRIVLKDQHAFDLVFCLLAGLMD